MGLNVLVVDSEEGSRHVDDGLGQAVDVVVIAWGQEWVGDMGGQGTWEG